MGGRLDFTIQRKHRWAVRQIFQLTRDAIAPTMENPLTENCASEETETFVVGTLNGSATKTWTFWSSWLISFVLADCGWTKNSNTKHCKLFGVDFSPKQSTVLHFRQQQQVALLYGSFLSPFRNRHCCGLLVKIHETEILQMNEIILTHKWRCAQIFWELFSRYECGITRLCTGDSEFSVRLPQFFSTKSLCFKKSLEIISFHATKR